MNVCVSVSLPYVFDMQITSFLRSVLLQPLACLALPYFSTLSHEWHDFRKKKKSLNIKSVFFSTTFVSTIFHSTKDTARYDCKYIDVFV